MNIFKAIPVLMLVAVLSACATAPQQSLTDIRELQTKRQQAATRTFNKTPDQIYDAAQTVFNAMDGGDFIYDLKEDRLLASRWWTFYAVFATGFGRQYFEVVTKPNDAATVVTLGEDEDAHTGMFSTPVSTQFKDHLSVGGNSRIGATIGDYNLFFDRLDYVLGLSDSWPSCENAQTYRNMETSKRLVFCDLVGIDDKTP
ncbi:hypothetical protein [Thalassospira sp. TSL5-1]|uniref:hypothetical protein n=1 Tax=Thalassospira sp. TSL5-1 TaxID=1544451 RepID=UPI00093E4485|nr:hypothetical protein [Thalassospira sp. TSL5-1]OKH89226.1 hypothetical protein LF95_04150 [Thalassospira sp. TSL5-1]